MFTMTETIPEIAPTGKDEEGIMKFYVDDPAKEKQKWFLSKDGPKSPRLDGKGDRKVLDGGAIQVKHESGSSGTARIYIYTTNPKADSTEEQLKIGKDWAQLEAKGYMIGPEDYCDAEVSAYYKITNSDNDDEFTIYWRGGAHPHDDKWPLQCVSCCLKAQIRMKLDVRSAKEYHHFNSPDGYAWFNQSGEKPMFDIKGELGGNMIGKIIGEKLVLWNEKDANGKVVAVHFELYADLGSKDLDKPDFSKQNWRLVHEWIDKGDWPKPKNSEHIKNCNAKENQLITWGGPYVALRIDGNNFNLYSLSVRPILPVKVQA